MKDEIGFGVKELSMELCAGFHSMLVLYLLYQYKFNFALVTMTKFPKENRLDHQQLSRFRNLPILKPKASNLV